MSSKKNIGFLISEYPGQTHSFFWREMSALRRLYGHDVQVIGTRPNAKPAQHDWVQHAPADYLYPIAKRDLPGLALASLGGLIRFLRHRDSWALLRSRQAFKALVLAVRLHHAVQRHKLTHVHVHSCANSALIAAMCQRMYGHPYSLTLHGPLHYFGDHQPYKWRHAAFVFVITETLRRDALEVVPEAADKITVVPMGVDTDQFAPAPVAPARDTFRWFACGRLTPGKGFDTIIRAAQSLRQSQPDLDFTLRIAGEDEAQGQGYRKVLQAQIDEAGLSPYVTLLGTIAQGDVLENLHKAHGFVLISNEEALGVAYMEAMACGLPTIGARTGGVGELISHDVDGFLVAPGQDGDLAQVMSRLMGDSDLCARIGAAARTKIVENFSSERSAHALGAIFSDEGNPAD